MDAVGASLQQEGPAAGEGTVRGGSSPPGDAAGSSVPCGRPLWVEEACRVQGTAGEVHSRGEGGQHGGAKLTVLSSLILVLAPCQGPWTQPRAQLPRLPQVKVSVPPGSSSFCTGRGRTGAVPERHGARHALRPGPGGGGPGEAAAGDLAAQRHLPHRGQHDRLRHLRLAQGRAPAQRLLRAGPGRLGRGGPLLRLRGPVLRRAGHHRGQVGGQLRLHPGGLRGAGGLRPPLGLPAHHRAHQPGRHRPDLRQLHGAARLPLLPRALRRPPPAGRRLHLPPDLRQLRLREMGDAGAGRLHLRQAAGPAGPHHRRHRAPGTGTLRALCRPLCGLLAGGGRPGTGPVLRPLLLLGLGHPQLRHRGDQGPRAEPAAGHRGVHAGGDDHLPAHQRGLLHRPGAPRAAGQRRRRRELRRPHLRRLQLDHPAGRGLVLLRGPQRLHPGRLQAVLRGLAGGAPARCPLHDPRGAVHARAGPALQRGHGSDLPLRGGHLPAHQLLQLQLLVLRGPVHRRAALPALEGARQAPPPQAQHRLPAALLPLHRVPGGRAAVHRHAQLAHRHRHCALRPARLLPAGAGARRPPPPLAAGRRGRGLPLHPAALPLRGDGAGPRRHSPQVPVTEPAGEGRRRPSPDAPRTNSPPVTYWPRGPRRQLLRINQHHSSHGQLWASCLPPGNPPPPPAPLAEGSPHALRPRAPCASCPPTWDSPPPELQRGPKCPPTAAPQR